MTKKEIQDLALKYLNGQANKEEEALLHSWYEHKEEEVVTVHSGQEEFEDVRARILESIQKDIKGASKLRLYSNRGIKRSFYYAASIFLIISFTGFYFYLENQAPTKNYYTQLLKNDVGPGGNNAFLELADGTVINLDEADIGGLTKTNGLAISKIDNGLIELKVEDFNGKDLGEINTIQTPRGGQYRVKLPDGTMVWLNAYTILKFPSVFDRNSREVELEGEAYFEVAHIPNAGQPIPFFVNSKEQRVEVLGTHFNVNSYLNERMTTTTLIEGSVRIISISSQTGKLLKPGQRSQVHKGNIDIGASMESDLSWKDGDFIFDKESLEAIMRKIERWYDVEIVYEGTQKNLRFSGAVSRSKNLTEVLKIMELTGKIHFKIEGRRVVVMT